MNGSRLANLLAHHSKHKQSKHQQSMRFDHMLELHNHVTKSVIMTVVAATFTAFLLDYYYTDYVLHWLFFVYGFSLVRFFHFKRLDLTQITYEKMKRQVHGYFFLTLLEAAHWAIPLLLFFEQNLLGLYNLFFLSIIIAMVTASIVMFPAHLAMYTCYSVIISLPIALHFMSNERFVIYQVIGVMVLIYVAILLVFHQRNTIKSKQALALKYENMDLINDLELQTQESKKQQHIAEKANQEKSHFIAAASHDIRQPLHAVNLFTELLRNKVTDEEQAQDVNNIQKGLDSLEELLHALLDISRLDSGVVAIKKMHFPINHLLNKLQEQLHIQAQQKELLLMIKPNQTTVFSDPLLLERVLGNLLSNAIKYTERGSVELFCSQEDNDNLTICVRDSGIGIAETHFNDIFSEFFQIDNQERDRQKGLGLGLSIVNKITSLMEMPLSFDSRLGQGTTFTLTVPLGIESTQLDQIQEKPVERRIEKLSVLIIDNSTDILTATQSLLESWGCTVHATNSGEKALKLIHDGSRPDFILTDYRLDGALNGCEIIHQIHALIGDIPAIIVTGNTDQNTLNEIKKTGLALLHKPLKPAQLRLTMTRLIEFT